MQLDSGELWDYQERKQSGKTFDVGSNVPVVGNQTSQLTAFA